MVTVSNIERPLHRFLSRDELEGIKNRAQRLPSGTYHTKGNSLLCLSSNQAELEIAQIQYPGLEDFFKKIKNDLEGLITHVEQADQENDYLKSLLQKEEEEDDEASGD